jgi:hypothetical protein
LRGQGTLFALARRFLIARQQETELVPVPMDVRLPPHLYILVLSEEDSQKRGLGPGEREMTHPLDAAPYVLVFQSEPQEPDGAALFALGLHLRLPNDVTGLMLDPASIALKRVCLPLGESMLDPGEADGGPEKMDLRHVVQTAWENGMIPVLAAGLLPTGEMQVVAATPVTLCSADDPPMGAGFPQSRARLIWSDLVSGCRESPQEALSHFRDSWATLAEGGLSDRLRAMVHVVEFQAATECVTYPMVVLDSNGKADVAATS